MPATTSKPTQEAPMRLNPTANTSSDIITQQPKSEPVPDLQNDAEMNLRGGRFSVGCHCCRGMCSFHKGCC
ncbi:hypothetical protein QBC38DRAFT_481700 [Podospora fimiseda]|uniref:Uncharacterized protein n=1 Tax=Podospora fimiseda TaxID=252190 RepID=A0AAN7BME6_9PEZI|nr:hypothetical protein QBC38DRAFT_481700 [Podospora fimiseda]